MESEYCHTKRGNKQRLITSNGKTMNCTQWLELLRVSNRTFWKYLKGPKQEFDRFIECRLRLMGEYGQSNADRIRSMSNEELLEFLLEFEIGDIDYSKTFCDMCEKSCEESGKSTECENCLKWWLEKDSKDVQGIDYWNNR